jgi:hypothetical protein
MKNVQIQTQQHKHQIRKDFKQKKKARFCLQSSIDQESKVYLLRLSLNQHDFYRKKVSV